MRCCAEQRCVKQSKCRGLNDDLRQHCVTEIQTLTVASSAFRLGELLLLDAHLSWYSALYTHSFNPIDLVFLLRELLSSDLHMLGGGALLVPSNCRRPMQLLV